MQVSRRDEVGLRARIFECPFDEVLNLVPVVGLDALNAAVEVLLNLPQHLPFVAVGDEGNGHTDATETTGTTDTVKIGLVIGFPGARAARVSLRNILDKRVSLNLWQLPGEHT